MQVLLTNDDGIHSLGLKALAEALQSLGNVCVAAPMTEQSGVSHSLTFRTPLLVHEVHWKNGIAAFAVEGTPADCTRIGILNLCETKPDIVVSGINHGLNLGCNVIYSGTIAGAEEGAVLGIDSFAVSLEYDEIPPWERASELAVQVIRQIVASRVNFGKANLVNVNIPLSACYAKQAAGVCVVPVDQSPFNEPYLERQTPTGSSYYWLSGKITPTVSSQPTDRTMLKKGFVTVTPLEYNKTNRTAIEKLELAFVDRSADSRDALTENENLPILPLPEHVDIQEPTDIFIGDYVTGLVAKLPDNIPPETAPIAKPEEIRNNITNHSEKTPEPEHEPKSMPEHFLPGVSKSASTKEKNENFSPHSEGT
ncbi:MAG: 5'/3'-nucleotidase SurE [Planctomycetaceae bacterium]|nr:5'/3'-nucleotidase SurE [Planctomycetaceae bacterium]